MFLPTFLLMVGVKCGFFAVGEEIEALEENSSFPSLASFLEKRREDNFFSNGRFFFTSVFLSSALVSSVSSTFFGSVSSIFFPGCNEVKDRCHVARTFPFH